MNDVNYPLAKVLALLETSKTMQGDESNPDYERLLQSLLSYEQQDVKWGESEHLQLTPQTAAHAVRFGGPAAVSSVLSVGESLYFEVDYPVGNVAQITAYRPLNQSQQTLRGSVLTTPEAQETWIGTIVLLREGRVIIDSAMIDSNGDFELTLLAFDQGKFQLEFRLPSGENIQLERFTLNS